jgi:hypothetical protein
VSTDFDAALAALVERAEAEERTSKEARDKATEAHTRAKTRLTALRTAMEQIHGTGSANGKPVQAEGEYVDEELVEQVRQARGAA